MSREVEVFEHDRDHQVLGTRYLVQVDINRVKNMQQTLRDDASNSR